MDDIASDDIVGSGVLEEFCGSPFWNETLTWQTEDPDFTSCFEKTVLVWVPCGFLWVFLPLESFYLHSALNRLVPWTWINVTKILASAGLLVVLLCQLGFTFDTKDVYPVDYVKPSLLVVTLVLQLVILLMEKKRGIQSSGYLWIFWFLMLICSVPEYRSNFREFSGEATSSFILNMIYFPLVVLVFVLNCFGDGRPKQLVQERGPNSSPYLEASFLSRLVFGWLERLVWRGYRTPLTQDDLYDLAYDNCANTVHRNWDKNWQKALDKAVKKGVVKKSTATYSDGKVQIEFSNEEGKKQVSIFSTLVATFGGPFLFGGILQLIYALMAFISPWLLDLLIKFTNNKGTVDEEPIWHGLLYAGMLLVNGEIMSLLQSQYYEKMYTITVKIRTAVINAIYRKALRISNSSRKGSTVGEIVNLMAVDSQRLMDLTMYVNMLWSAPVQIILAITLLYQILGPSVFAGLAVMILLIPINGFVATKQRGLQVEQMKNKDKRVKLMNELLNGMKVLKLYGWEPSFEKEVNSIRDKEISVMKTSAYLSAVISFVFTCTPFLVTLAMFTTFVLSNPSVNILTSENIFVSMSLLNILNIPMAMVPMLIVASIQAWVSMGRINNFLNSEELDAQAVSHENKSDAIVVDDGEFWWGHSDEDKAILKNISVNVKYGALVAVVGSVGSGKSSLCSAILGEMEKKSGSVNIKGSVAYVAQQAWIQNATVEKNILFNKEIDSSRYKTVIGQCALQADLDMLPGGDQTEIGEKGINLSGGQKQRVSLARAVYSDSDIYLLDDPLSAVDSHVGKHIFEKVIGPTGCLKKKTRILVTHALTYLPEVDHIIVLKDGVITEQGSYQELLNTKGEFQDFLLQYLAEAGDDLEDLEKIKSEIEEKIGKDQFQRSVSRIKRESESSGGGESNLSELENSIEQSKEASIRSNGSLRRRGSAKPEETKKEDPKKIGQKLIEAEKSETGRVSASVYSYYFKSIGALAGLLYILFISLAQGCMVVSGLVLSAWADSNGNGSVPQDPTERDTYLGIYGGLGAGQAVTVLVSSMIIAHGTIAASRITHSRMLANILRNPMSFFDMTPIGRIVNRFSKDLDSIDVMLPMSIRNFMQFAIMVLGTILIIGVATPMALVVIVPAFVIYYFVQLLYVTTSRQLKRLESVSRSPIYSHFGETISGASTIRAYGMNDSFIEESEKKCDYNQMAYFPSVLSNRWLSIRLEFIGNLITFSAALFAVFSDISSGVLGLSLTNALSITQILTWLVRFVAELENNIVAVERVKEYSETAVEAAWDIPNTKPNQDWPDKGVVKFSNYSTRYREGLDLVVKGIDCEIQAEEKIGIVGRTGAGKSSLTVGLFRIIEAAGGSITIDGVDISKIGLHDLRTKLTIIPQDPVLFSGSLRLNLDPANMYSDEAIWSALEHGHLKGFVSELPNKLQHEITEGGDNLSVGQRQLVCLARALLRKTRVLILDEATAAVDLETDDLIQQTIKREFAHCTVITIAHRLNTIMDSTRVLVLDKGEIREFDPPSVLLKNTSSIFYGMAKDAGLV